MKKMNTMVMVVALVIISILSIAGMNHFRHESNEKSLEIAEMQSQLEEYDQLKEEYEITQMEIDTMIPVSECIPLEDVEDRFVTNDGHYGVIIKDINFQLDDPDNNNYATILEIERNSNIYAMTGTITSSEKETEIITEDGNIWVVDEYIAKTGTEVEVTFDRKGNEDVTDDEIINITVSYSYEG